MVSFCLLVFSPREAAAGFDWLFGRFFNAYAVVPAAFLGAEVFLAFFQVFTVGEAVILLFAARAFFPAAFEYVEEPHN
jgi:hypothetical protein